MRSSPAQHADLAYPLPEKLFDIDRSRASNVNVRGDRFEKMRYLLRMVPSAGDPPTTVQMLRRIASSIGGKVVNPKTTSYGAVEVDIFVRSSQDLDLFLAAVEPLGTVEFVKDLQVTPGFLPREEAVCEAVSLFNSERYWEAHEVLEPQWRSSDGQEKRVLQGLILACAALVHLQKGEEAVAIGVASRSLAILPSDTKIYYGVDLIKLKHDVSAMLAAKKMSFFRLIIQRPEG